MIDRAVYDPRAADGGPDIVIIRAFLADLPNPPHYPDWRDLAAFVKDPYSSLFTNREYGLLARVRVLPKRREVMLAWFGPLAPAPGVTLRTQARRLRAISLAAEQDALDKYPEAADWRYWAMPQVKAKGGAVVLPDGGRALATFLQHEDFYPTGRIATSTDLGVERVSFSSTLADVIAAARVVP